MPGCEALELRYSVLPEEGNVARLGLRCSVKVNGDPNGVAQILAAARSVLEAANLQVGPAVARPWPGGAHPIYLDVRRRELVTYPAGTDVSRESYYYSILGEGGDGWQVARRARARWDRLPVIYMTGERADEWAPQHVPLGVLLLKPFPVSQLVEMVGQLLAASREGARQSA